MTRSPTEVNPTAGCPLSRVAGRTSSLHVDGRRNWIQLPLVLHATVALTISGGGLLVTPCSYWLSAAMSCMNCDWETWALNQFRVHWQNAGPEIFCSQLL